MKLRVNLPIFDHQAGYAGKFAGVVSDDNQAMGASDSGDLQVVRANGFTLAGKSSADVAEMLGSVIIIKRQAGKVSKESAQAGLIRALWEFPV